MAVTLAEVEATLKLFAATDWTGAYRSFRTGNIAGDVKTVEDAIKIVGVFVPDVAQAEAIVEIAAPILTLILQHSTPVVPGTPGPGSPEGTGHIDV